MTEIENKQIEEYYDEYVFRQVKSGINKRHESIVQFCKDSCCLNASSKVLEIGCGVGTATTLLSAIVTEGSILAIDISQKSIQEAKKALGNQQNVEFLVSDMTDFESKEQFDLIVLPDVIEHIPVDQHANLFHKLESCLKVDGKIMIHIPDPDYTDYIRDNKPELLQVVDQSLRFNDLVQSFSKTNLDVVYWERYSVFMKPFDYRRIILEHGEREYRRFDHVQTRLLSRLKRKVKRFIH